MNTYIFWSYTLQEEISVTAASLEEAEQIMMQDDILSHQCVSTNYQLAY